MTMYAITSGILSFYFWAKCSVCLGPIAAYSFYTIATFPTMLAFDVYFVDEPPDISNRYMLGAAIILVAFMAITVYDWMEGEPI